MRRRVRAAASFALALAVLVLFLRAVGPAGLARDLAGARPMPAALAALLSLGTFLAWSESLRQLFLGAGTRVAPTRFRLAFFSGVFAKQVLPAGNASGPALIAFAVNAESGERYEHDLAVATVGELTNLATSFAVALAALLALAATGYGGPALVAVGAVVGVGALAVGVALVLLFVRRSAVDAAVRRLAAGLRATAGRLSGRVAVALAPERVDAWLAGFGRALSTVAADRRALAAGVAYSALGWGCVSLALWLSALALGHTLPVALALFAVPVGGFASAVPLPGGVGGIEVATAGLLVVIAGTDLVAATATVLLFRLLSFWLVLLAAGAASVYHSVGLAEMPGLPPEPE